MSRILCIEDETEIREFLVETLAEAGYDIASAGNGHEGLALMSSYAPDLVVSDLSMPVMNGLELLNIVRNEYLHFADIPFILLTGHTDRDAMIKGLTSGADDYLTKPVDVTHLLAKVAAILRQVSRMRDKKQAEHIKLYKALAGLTDDVAQGDEGSSEPLPSICLIGCEEPSFNDLKVQLEQSGMAVTHFTSGRKFLDSIDTLSPVAALISFFTEDVQGNLVARFAKKKRSTLDSSLDYPLVLLWPSESGRVPPQIRDEPAIDDFVVLPALDIEERIGMWKEAAQNAFSKPEAPSHA